MVQRADPHEPDRRRGIEAPDCDLTVRAPGDALTLPAHFQANGYTTISRGKISHHRRDNADDWSQPPTGPKGPWYGPGYHRPENQRKGGWYTAAPVEFSDRPDEHFPDGANAAQVVDDLRQLSQQSAPFFLAAAPI